MEQQRHRRLKSAKKKNMGYKCYYSWNTIYENKLNCHLKEKCKSLKIKGIISDSNAKPGGIIKDKNNVHG